MESIRIDRVRQLLIALPALVIGVAHLNNTYDDAFITYRYAYNLATGKGFVYNVGEWFLGTSAPLYGLLLGALGAIVGPASIPLSSGYLSGVSLTLTGIALYVYGRAHAQPLLGFLAGLFFVVNPLLPSTFGGEALFQIALLAWAFVLYESERGLGAALLLALAILARPDAVLAAAVLLVHALALRRRVPWRELCVAALVLVPFVLLAWIHYGSPLPATLEAKLAQRDSGLWQPFLVGLWQWLCAFTLQDGSWLYPGLPAAPGAVLFVPLVVAGVGALWFFRSWLLPLAWVALYVLAYRVLDVPFYHWYVVPVAFGIAILSACAVAGSLELCRSWNRRFASALGIVWVLVLSPLVLRLTWHDVRLAASEPTPIEELYEKTGRWLEERTPSGSSVGYFEIGGMGYHARRTMIDPFGIVNPGVAPHVARLDFTWAYEHYRPDYIVHNPMIWVPFIGQVVETPWFRSEYREVARMSQPGVDLPLVIYRRVALRSGADIRRESPGRAAGPGARARLGARGVDRRHEVRE